jgi:16S rRNA (cytidine1402-2'-O)-methyltransferase
VRRPTLCPVPGRLTVCPTPIGNLDDLPPRAREALADCDLVACEDTRHTGLLLHRLGIDRPLLSIEAHRELRVAEDLGRRLTDALHVCLVTDAGTPGLSDPGRAVISAALAAGAEVDVLPGPSAITTALVASGLPADRFAFIGFLPRGAGAIGKTLDETDRWGVTLIAFESPKRLPGTLRLIAERESERPIAVCRELTKVHQEVARGTAVEVAARFAEAPRGEVTLVLGAARTAGADPVAIEQALGDLRAHGIGARDAARIAAALTGRSARDLYRP